MIEKRIIKVGVGFSALLSINVILAVGFCVN
jgi:hypothetical protein